MKLHDYLGAKCNSKTINLVTRTVGGISLVAPINNVDAAPIEWLSINDIEMYASAKYPGRKIFDIGYYPFGRSGDGSLYYHTFKYGNVVHLGVGRLQNDGVEFYDPVETKPYTYDNIHDAADGKWSTLDDFYKWYDVQHAHCLEIRRKFA